MGALTFCWFGWESPLFQQAKAVRRAVFVEEQGFSLAGEFDEIDKRARHLLALHGEQAVGAARVYAEEPGVLHVGRVALLAACRGRGYGAELMEELRRMAEEAGVWRLVLSAQADKAGFYEKAGYSPTGRSELDEGCPHVEMQRILPAGWEAPAGI